MKRFIFALCFTVLLCVSASAEIISGPGVAVVDVEGGNYKVTFMTGFLHISECLMLKQKFSCRQQN